MAWTPPSKPGDSDPLLPFARKHLSRFSYGATLKGTTSEVLDADYLAAQHQFKVNRHAEVIRGLKPGPDLDPASDAFDWATKKQLGLLDASPSTPAPTGPRHPAFVFRGTGGIIGQDYVSRVCQGAADLVEEINTPWAATMGGIPVGASGGFGDPSMWRAVQEAFTAAKAEFTRRRTANPNMKAVIGGYSAGAVVAALLRQWVLANYPDNYLCSFSLGDPTRPEGGSFYGGIDPGGHGISSWLFGDPTDYRHCWLTNVSDPNRPDMYGRVPKGATGKIMQDAFDMVTHVEFSDPIETARQIIPVIPQIAADAGIGIPDALGALAAGIPGLIGWGLPLLTGALGGLIGGGNPDTLTGTAAAAKAGQIALTFALDSPPTRAHITYEFAEVWPGQTYLGLAIQHVRDWCTRTPALAA
ncbi:hypothetical protein [Mycobacteroides franklinii]|uniref:Lysin B n=1 Tax=Mycobacteroides franklinii TaxID=948102 RepID=A0A4R5PGA6_9MYCO|nr:hypothetical protein [Mycobacteroides franklinii]ORA56335.1 hypothetical protein BST24_25020 [Mycobacteroides franklinii]TDH25319.1 hypothetical protein EJ571_01530 [Mycobacteroides franklinii]